MSDPTSEAEAPAKSRAEAAIEQHLGEVAPTATGFLRALRVEAGLLTVVFFVWTVFEWGLVLGGKGPGGALVVGLAAASAVPVLMLGLWLDRHEPEPIWALGRCFLWGAVVATSVAGFINHLTNTSFGRPAMVLLSAPLAEEAMKGLVLLWLLRHRGAHLNGWLDAVIYALFVGTGFAFVENLEYYHKASANGWDDLAVTALLRGVLSPFAHPLFTLCTATGIVAAAGAAGFRRLAYPVAGYLGSVVGHSLWNAGMPELVYGPVLFPAFLYLAQRTLAVTRQEGVRLRESIQEHVARGDLPENSLATLQHELRPSAFDWFDALGSSAHALHRLWERRHLAWLVASRPDAERLAGSWGSAVTPAELQRCALDRLRRSIVAECSQPSQPPTGS